MKALAALSPLALLAGCVTYHDAPIVEHAPPATEGTPVGLTQPVTTGKLVVTPMLVAQDSRCPANAQCTWAGKLVVATRIDGAGWHETADLTLGQPYATHGTSLTLISGTPDKYTYKAIDPTEYRFVYDGGD